MENFKPVNPRIIDARTPEQKAKAEAKAKQRKTQIIEYNRQYKSAVSERPRWRWHGGATGDVEPE